MKGYKGFETGLVCCGRQYAENTVFEDVTNLYDKSMCFYQSPLDVFERYPMINKYGGFNEYAEVDAEGVVFDDYLCRATQLKIGKRLSLFQFISTILASRECHSLDLDEIVTDISGARLGSLEAGAKIISGGYNSTVISKGEGSQIASLGAYTLIDSSGEQSDIVSYGDGSIILCSGANTKVVSMGERDTILCTGPNSMARAKIGSAITLFEYSVNRSYKLQFVGKRKEIVDGVKIKEDVYYTLMSGEFTQIDKLEDV